MRTSPHYFVPLMAPDRIRTTISLDPEVHAIFVSMAETAGTSVSRCMGDWLADTAEGAQFVAHKMAEARRAPKTVMREMQAFAQGLVDEVDATVQALRQGGRAGGMRPGAHPRPAALPRPDAPSSLTGLKSPGKGAAKGAKQGRKS
jgi:hypothetical protein